LLSMIPFDDTTSGSSVSSSSKSVGLLTSIWQSLLHQSSIGVDDNFFSLGGNRRIADLLFADIERKLGRELPSATIFRAQTIAALASVLDQPNLPRFSPFVKMKAGTGGTPILIAPGLDGCASFSKLAKRIQTDHPIYGIQAKGVDGMENPFDCVEDMAQYYVEGLAEFQPNGPYILIGYSFGGLVALEMAQHLFDSGKQVGLLVLIDAYPHPRNLSSGQRVRLSVQRAARHISEMKEKPIHGAMAYFFSGLNRRLGIAGANDGQDALAMSRLSLARTTLKVKHMSYVALARYRPRAYSGDMKFIKSENDTYFPGDPRPVWANLARTFEVETVSGNHLDMVTTHFEGLAAALTRYLSELHY
jgi:acetoacetyl-CoA synthetase